MTTTNLYSGLDTSAKPSSRVLNPPGGRSNNIFGGDDTPPQRQQVREQAPQRQATNQNDNAGGTQGYPDQHQQGDLQKDNKKKDRGGPAPFASFEDSGKPSAPTQFDRCDGGSQNDADFRSYSVTAYRDAVQQNAAIRNKARGQATSGFNLITHEDGNGSSFSDYDQARNQHQQQRHHTQPVESHGGKRQLQNQNKAPRFNPITGEEYPENYGQEKPSDKATDEEEESTEDNKTAEDDKPEETKSSTANARDGSDKKPTPTPAPAHFVKVRQPPGGASSGLW